MKSILLLFVCGFTTFYLNAQPQKKIAEKSGNPVFPGWYADPEGIIFGKTYWILHFLISMRTRYLWMLFLHQI